MTKGQIDINSILGDTLAIIRAMPQEAADTFDFQTELGKLIAEGQASPENVAALASQASSLDERSKVLALTTRKVMKNGEDGTPTVVEEDMGFSVGQAIAAMKAMTQAYTSMSAVLRTILPSGFAFDPVKMDIYKAQAQPVRRTTTSSAEGSKESNGNGSGSRLDLDEVERRMNEKGVGAIGFDKWDAKIMIRDGKAYKCNWNRAEWVAEGQAYDTIALCAEAIMGTAIPYWNRLAAYATNGRKFISADDKKPVDLIQVIGWGKVEAIPVTTK